MDTQTCPKCGFAREPRAVDCPVCGIVFAKYQAAPAATPEPPPIPSSPPPSAAFNPYAPPRSADLPQPPPLPSSMAALATGIWRSHDLLILEKGTQLPGRCVACNRPTVHRWHKTFYWAPPAFRLLILFNLLIYAIVLFAVRKRADVAIPLCDEHEEKRRTGTRNGWILGLLGLALIIASFFTLGDNSSVAFGILFVVGLIALIAGAVVSSNAIPLQPKKIDNNYAWMKKAAPEFLFTLPEAPTGFGL